MGSRLTDGFRDIIELRWSEFCEMEQSLDATNFDAVVTGIVRACKKGNLRAIQTALDRLDGKIASEIEVEYPKFYTVYPQATKTADDPNIIEVPFRGPANEKEMLRLDKHTGSLIEHVSAGPADMDEQHAAEEELPTGSLRAVLEKMLDSPKQLVNEILDTADAVETGDAMGGNPMVKSVIVAGLMKLVHQGRISAVFEVFNQIDGKVADKIKIFGNDVYVKKYDLIAPAGAIKNENGIYQIEAPQMTGVWEARLEQLNKGRNNGR
jgi:hypothetical protein